MTWFSVYVAGEF